MPRDWRAVVDGMTDVQKLVHLAARWDAFDEEATRGSLLRAMRRHYDDELTIQAGRIGCPGRRGQVRNGPILTELNNVCIGHAASIVNTYNYDLAIAIRHIGVETPTANRHVYASRLQAWEAARAKWKGPQIEMMTDGFARSKAQQDFYDYNGHGGTATLEPRIAVCPICQGWIDRGEVPLRVAENEPPPYHVACPHIWVTRPDQWAKENCPLLWMGE